MTAGPGRPAPRPPPVPWAGSCQTRRRKPGKVGVMPLRDQLERLVDEMVTKGIRYDEAQREFEKKFIAQVLLKADGNLGKAADLLGIHRNTLARKMSEYRLRRSA